jgi:hypothetical protein
MPNSETDYHIEKAILIELSAPVLKSPESDVCSASLDYKGNSDKYWTALSRQSGNTLALHELLYANLRQIPRYPCTVIPGRKQSPENDLSYERMQNKESNRVSLANFVGRLSINLLYPMPLKNLTIPN